MKLYLLKEDCSGCESCANICPVADENSNKPIIERTRSDIEAHKRVKAGLRGGMMAGGLGAGGTFLPGDPLSTGVYSYFTGFLAEAVNTLF